MRNEVLARPTAHALVALLKTCTKLKDVERAFEIHADIFKTRLLEENVYVGSALVDTYAKCGLLGKARQVFDMLQSRNIVVWTALIGGYVEHEHGEEALHCFEEMQMDGIPPDAVTFVLGLKACSSIKAIDKGREMHAEIERQGLLERNLFVGSALVDMYAKCKSLGIAHQVADKLKVQNLASWNALISGYTEQGHGGEALNCLEQLQLKGISPDVVTYTCCMKACGSIGDIDMGQEIHAELERQGLPERDHAISNVLVDMYIKCGWLALAHELFNKLRIRNVVSWNSMIAGYSEHGHAEEALKCFQSMKCRGVSPNHLTLVCALKACSSLGDAKTGQELHAEIEGKGFLQKDVVVGNTLVDMYAKCGLLSIAQKVFDKLAVRDTVSWTVLIAGYAEHGYGELALKHLEKMEFEAISPNEVTFVCSLKACTDLIFKEKGLEIHAEIERRALLFGDVGAYIINMYVKFGFLSNAKEIFDRLPVYDIGLWNTLLVGYAEHGHDEEVIKCFDQMQLKGLVANAVTFVWILKACGNLRAIDKGLEVHAEAERMGWLEADLSVSSALVNLYSKCGFLGKAQEIFDKLNVRDVVLWTALIAGYTENEQGEEALECLEQMQREGVSPNDVTLVCSLKACGSLGAVNTGHSLHAEIERKGLLGKYPLVGNTLVDMYARLGLLARAQQVFDKLPVRNVISWTALMVGYAQLGIGKDIFPIFDRMLFECVKPDSIMFVVILNVCSRMGFLNESETYFQAMSKDYGIVPMREHHFCMVDLLAREGYLDKAVEMISESPYCSDLVPWHTLLSACKRFGNVKFGKHAFDNAVHLDEKNAVPFVLMSQILAGGKHMGENSLEV